MKATRATMFALGAVAMAATVLPTPAMAETPAPGSVIDRTNIDKYKDLFGPAMIWSIDRGVKIHVGPYQKIEMAKPKKEAT